MYRDVFTLRHPRMSRTTLWVFNAFPRRRSTIFFLFKGRSYKSEVVGLRSGVTNFFLFSFPFFLSFLLFRMLLGLELQFFFFFKIENTGLSIVGFSHCKFKDLSVKTVFIVLECSPFF